MPIKNGRVNVRWFKDYDIKMVAAKLGSVGEIEEISWYPAAENIAPEGMVTVAISVRVKKLNPNIRVTPKDTFQIVVNGRPGTVKQLVSETIQQVKFLQATVLVEGKEEKQEIPEAFEEGMVYTFTGTMLMEEKPQEEKRVAAAVRGGAVGGTRR